MLYLIHTLLIIGYIHVWGS